MPPDRTPADREPAPGSEPGAGSVVVGLDPATPAGVTLFKVRPAPEALVERLDAFAAVFQQFRENLARSAHSPVRAGLEMRRSMEGTRAASYTRPSGDAMHWSPPADGEETPPCPA